MCGAQCTNGLGRGQRSRLPAAVDSTGFLTKTTHETAECLLRSLIPTDEIPPVLRVDRVDRVGSIIGGDEVKRAVWRVPPGKAPGLDGITGAVLRKAWGAIGGFFTEILDRCIRNSYFPDCWKTADIVTIKKGADRDPSLPKS